MAEKRDQGHAAAGSEHGSGAIHLPGPSYWPLVLSIALVILAFGVILQPVVAVVAGLAALVSVIAWGLEGSD